MSPKPTVDLQAELNKEHTIKRKLRNLRKRVTQGRMSHAFFRVRAKEVIEEVLG